MRTLVLPLIFCACTTRDVSAVDPRPTSEVRELLPATGVPRLDLLFVVYNSDSMKEEQDNLARNFPRFMEVLAGIEGGLPSVHVGVVSSDVGIAPFTEEGCRAAGDDGLLLGGPPRFLEDVVLPDGERRRNYEGTLAEAFARVAALGTAGCGYEQHLEAMRRALDGSHPENGGFLRREAFLAVVVIADEDDCSARDPAVFNPDPALRGLAGPLGPAEYRCLEHGVLCDGAPPPRADGDFTGCVPRGDSFLHHPDDYAAFLRGLKDVPELVIVAAIAGDPTPVGAELTPLTLRVRPSCASANGEARPGVRLASFVRSFGDNGRFLSICADDLAPGLTEVARLLARKIATRCLGTQVSVEDVDPAAPGLQLDCVVTEERFGASRVLPRCAEGQSPCWFVRESPSCSAGYTLEIDREGEAEEGTSVIARCRAR